jgi:hypothetical protein
LIEVLRLWSRPEFLDRCLCLRPLIFEGPGFDPPKLVREYTIGAQKKIDKK